MPSSETTSVRITNKTLNEIEEWRKKISAAVGIDIKKVTKRWGEIALRLSSKRGSVKVSELRDILLGKIK